MRTPNYKKILQNATQNHPKKVKNAIMLFTFTLSVLLLLQYGHSFLPPTQSVASHHHPAQSLISTSFTSRRPIKLKMTAAADTIRSELLSIIGKNPEGHKDEAVRTAFASKLEEYSTTEGADPNDVIFAIGKSVFGVDLPDAKKAKTNGSSKPAEELPIVDFEYMKEFMKEVFLSYGVTPERAEICSDVLIEADKRGIDSHGLGRLKPIYCDRMDDGILWPEKPIDIITESETTALVDGNLGLGLYIGPHCMQMAIDKAKKYGVGFVACRNSTHYGIAGYYATMATDQGCIGFTGTNARPSIAPTFGVEPMMVSFPLFTFFPTPLVKKSSHVSAFHNKQGTNPLVFGLPSSDDFPFVIDCATSVNQRGKIEKYAREGVDTPAGAVIDDQGIERTDTEGILRDMVLGKCALTPVGGAGDKMGGYKGFGWAATVELLCTALQSGPWGEDICGVDRATGKPKPMPLGHFFLAIDIEKICPLDTFKKNTGEFLKAVRESKKAPTGPGRIWTAGEPENDARIARTAQGGMKVVVPLQKNMIDLRNTRPGLKEKYPKLPFE
jgi:L-2-hydroxycarboxylate dehydrogenase (NAD+)